MGISERKERDKQELRQRIIDAAKDIFIEQGFEKASIRAIAERIEYSPATIYLHFKDKDELLHAIHELGFLQLAALKKDLTSIQDGFEQLTQRAKIYLQFAIDNPEMYGLMFIQDAPMEAIKKCKEDDEWDCGMEVFEGLVQNLVLCIKQGLIPDTEVHVLAMTVWSYIHGIASLYIKGRFFMFESKGLDIHQMIDASFKVMLNSLKLNK